MIIVYPLVDIVIIKQNVVAVVESIGQILVDLRGGAGVLMLT